MPYVIIGGTAADSLARIDTVYVRTATGWTGSAAVTAGAWSCSVPLSAASTVITASCTDAATNTMLDTVQVDYDTAAPLVIITAPANNSGTSVQTVTVRGTAADSVTAVGGAIVRINNVLTAVTAVSNGTFTVSVALPAGACSISVSCSDAFGAYGHDTITVTLDTGVPLVQITNFASGADTSASVAVPLSGTAADSFSAVSAVAVSVNGSGTSVVALAGGRWSTAANLAVGVNTVMATCSDALGNETRAVAVLYYDTGAPVITGVAALFSSDSVVDYDTPLSAAADTIWVNPVAGFTCTFTVAFVEPSPLAVTGSTNFGQTPADTQAAGGWTVAYIVPAGLAADTTVIITVTDVSGKTDTVAYVFAVDNYCPAVTLVTPADLAETTVATPLFGWTATADTGAGLAYFRVELDTDAVWTAVTANETTTLTTWTPATALTSDTWYWRVTAVDSAGNVSSAVQRSLRIPSTNFTPPFALTPALEAAGGGRYTVRLEWTATPDTRATRYHLYYEVDADGSDTLVHGDTTVSDTYISVPDTTWRSPFLLTADTRYVFALRAADTTTEEQNQNVQASIYVPAVTAGANDTGTAYIMTPNSGQSVRGTAVTVAADLVDIDADGVAHVTFQYRRTGDSMWSDIVSSSEMPNPDPTWPYYVHWDVNGTLGVQSGIYILRTLVTYRTGSVVEQPVYKTISFGDTIAPDIREEDTGVLHCKQQRVWQNVATDVYLGDERDDLLLQLRVPAGAISDSQTFLRIEQYDDPNRYSDSLAAGEFTNLGEFRTFTFTNGDTQFAAGREVELWFPYADANNDGVVDGQILFETELKLYWYNDRTQTWEVVPGQTINTAENYIHARLTHFSTYAVFGPAAAANLDLVTVFPNPFRPNNNSADDGIPYQPGNQNSGIIFGNLSARVVIEIYDLSGRRVARLQPDNLSRNVQWDACDEDGSDVASGIYLYVITGADGKKRVGKLGIIR